MDINRLRHTMTPELAFDFIPIVTQDPEDLNQFDGTDALDTYSSIMFGLRNRLQTKRGKPGEEKSSVDIASFDTRVYLFPGNAGLNRKRDSFIELDFNLKLSERLSFYSQGNEYNLDENRFDIINSGIGYNHPKWGNFTIGNRYAKNILHPVTFSYSKGLGSGQKWSLNLSEQYALGTGVENSVSLFSSVNLQRLFHDWIVNIAISEIGFRDDDTIVSFSVIPRGIAKMKSQAFTLQQLGVLVPGQGER
jgi:hypothetical protein